MEELKSERTKIIIVGGSAAGLSAATRARRINELADITIIEESENIGYPLSAIPAFASGLIKKKETLISDQEEKLFDIYNLRIQKNHKATQIKKDEKLIIVKNLSSGKIIEMPYDKLILACGNKFILPKQFNQNIRNVSNLKNFEEALKIREYIDKTAVKEITIIGGNFYGLLAADSFIKKGFGVTIIEESDRILSEFDEEFSFFIKDELKKHGVKIYTGLSITKYIKEEKEIIHKIEFSNKKSILTQFVVFVNNISPNIDLANQAHLEIGDTGRIKVNDKMTTSDPNIYAIGNIAETFNAITKKPDNTFFIGPAQFQGRVAGTVAAGGDMSYTGIIGTMILKVLDLTIGITGLNYENALKNELNVFPLTMYSGNHERFFPDAQQLHFKIIVNEENRKVLGAQICSKGEGVDKKLNVLTTAIYSGLVVDDLINLDLGYHPQLNTAKDPINILGMISANRLDMLSNPVGLDEIELNVRTFILDIRTKNEYLKSHIEHSVWIPLNELRSRLDEIPKDMDIYIYGHIGLRGYVAERILKGSGFENVFNIEGGITSVKISEKMC